MQDAVIVSAARTAVGKAPGGTLRGTRPDELAAAAITEALKRAQGLDPADVDDVILGCAMPEAEQGMNVARIASLRAGIPVAASAVTVNRFCSSGLQAIAYAAERVMCGFATDHRRRRHRVDEPGADGRPQDCAEPDADGPLSGRLSEHRAWSPRIMRASRASRAKSRTRSRCAATSARSPRSRAGASPRRSSRSPRRLVDSGRQRARAENAPGDVRGRRRTAPRHVGRSAREAAARFPSRTAR